MDKLKGKSYKRKAEGSCNRRKWFTFAACVWPPSGLRPPGGHTQGQELLSQPTAVIMTMSQLKLVVMFN